MEEEDKIAENGFKPGTHFLDMYKQYIPKPKELDEKEIERKKTLAGISDALGMLTLTLGSAGGALTPQVDYNNSALSKISAREEEARRLYDSKLQQYRNGLYAAAGQDYSQARNEYNNYLSFKRNNDFQMKSQKDQAEREDKRLADQRAYQREENALQHKYTMQQIGARGTSSINSAIARSQYSGAGKKTISFLTPENAVKNVVIPDEYKRRIGAAIKQDPDKYENFLLGYLDGNGKVKAGVSDEVLTRAWLADYYRVNGELPDDFDGLPAGEKQGIDKSGSSPDELRKWASWRRE
ncbi:MAG: hypothetical protein LBJ17_08740 [Dysgonamonadaceae bacterium]|jgi:hypothetical protein|nr:hypothetical protein [Dysgonamonadaceae bacterium]